MKHMANQFLGLSLFIMLLSFFIILNALSDFEVTKAKPVLNSLTMAFSKEDPNNITPPGKTESLSEMMGEGDALDKIEALFQAQIVGVETKQNRLGTQMIVRMPYKDFQKSIRSSLLKPVPGQENNIQLSQNFLPVLISLLETQRNVTYKMDMMVNTPLNPSTLKLEDESKYLVISRSISSIAGALEDAGLPKKQVTAGMTKGQDGQVELMFRRYEPFDPLGTEINAQQGGG